MNPDPTHFRIYILPKKQKYRSVNHPREKISEAETVEPLFLYKGENQARVEASLGGHSSFIRYFSTNKNCKIKVNIKSWSSSTGEKVRVSGDGMPLVLQKSEEDQKRPLQNNTKTKETNHRA